MAAYLMPALDAYARFQPELSREDAKRLLFLSDEPAVALVIEGDARSDSKGVVGTVDFLREVTPSVPETTVPDAIFVTGDIVAPDAILQEHDSDWSPRLKVLGNVRVRTLFLYGSNSEIDGDLIAETVFGFYNHGSLHVRGALRADVLLDSDYTWKVDGPVECRFILGQFGRANFKSTHLPEDLTKILVWDAVTDRDDIAYGFIFEALTRGDPILRPADLIGTDPSPEIGVVARERLAALLERAEEVDLSNCQLRFVPEDLLRFTKLKRLLLKDNKVGSLPGWISQLDRLEVLDLENCGLTRVPSGLDALPALREINLEGNAIKEAAEHPGPLDALEMLTIGSRYHWIDDFDDVTHFTAVIDFATLPRLRVAHLIFGGEEVEYSDDARLWSTPTLENLALGFEAPFTLPRHLAEATGLRVLSVSLDGETAARSAEVLARMPSLELVNLDIFSKLSREQFDMICAAVPNAFVRHWSASPEFDKEEEALFDLTKSWRRTASEPTAGLAAAETLLATMDIRRCYGRCKALEEMLLFKAESLLEAALDAGGEQREQVADWGDHLLAEIPDLGDHIWRYPLNQLGYVRGLASLSAVLRPGNDAALATLAAIREKVAREIGPAPPFMKDKMAGWIDKTQSALTA